ncbi:hypothetical protein QAD02_010739 [Eretmocerus hayati]|uniref:Uncharacterized protein n=1 Tax=Eretmocerus hayati TaxID=131215 RepID=A0ACC2NVQ2_9HYME|nr:hypothetical protein QAD02_010739 [Eretmocerus hayati]
MHDTVASNENVNISSVKRPAEDDPSSKKSNKREIKSVEDSLAQQVNNTLPKENDPANSKKEENIRGSREQQEKPSDDTSDTTIPIYEMVGNPKQTTTQGKVRPMQKFTEFESRDHAPFKMFLQNKDNDPDKINPLVINRFLIRKFQNTEDIGECYPISNNKLCITVLNRQIANKILSLKEWKMNNLEVFIPNHLMTRQGVIKGVPEYFSEEEILQNLVAKDPHFGNVEIVNVKRFSTRKVNQESGQTIMLPTKTVQVTFRGQFLPPRVSMYKIHMRVEAYCPQVRQCYRCFNFGHVKANCKASQEICGHCGDPAHSPETPCSRKDLSPQCKNCKKNHRANDRACEVRKRQQEIRDLASTKNISVPEAKKIIISRKRYVTNSAEFPPLNSNLEHFQSQEYIGFSSTQGESYASRASQAPRQQDEMSQKYRLAKPLSASQKYPQRFQASSVSHNGGETSSPKGKKGQQNQTTEKYQNLEAERRKILLYPNGQIPSQKHSQTPNNVTSILQRQREIEEDMNSRGEIPNQELAQSIEAVGSLLETMSIEKIYSALEAWKNMYRSQRPGFSMQRWPDSNSNSSQNRKKWFKKQPNESQQWRLEYIQPIQQEATSEEGMDLSQEMFLTQEDPKN